MKGIDKMYVDLQMRWIKLLDKSGSGDTALYGEDESNVYIGLSYYLIKIPKEFFLLDKEKLNKIYPLTFREFQAAQRIFNDSVANAQFVGHDTMIRKERIYCGKKDKVFVIKQDGENGTEYHIKEKFFNEIKDFPIDGFKVSGHTNTATIITMNGEAFAMVLPVRM